MTARREPVTLAVWGPRPRVLLVRDDRGYHVETEHVDGGLACRYEPVPSLDDAFGLADNADQVRRLLTS